MRNFEWTSKHWQAVLLAASIVAAQLGSAATARADAKSCTNVHASAQREQKAGHLKAASEQFMACGSDESCPEAIRTDCMDRYASVEKLIPTVILSLVDERGNDVTSVQVYSNDQLLTSELDGRPIALEAGKYRFRFVLPSGQEVTSDVLIREGEKNRVVKAELPKSETEVPAAEADSGPELVEATVAPDTSRSPGAGFWIASGVAVAALGSFATFAILGRQKHESLADCSPECARSEQGDYDAMKRNYLIADISLGAAAVSAGVATVLFLTSGGKEAPPSAAKASLPRLSVAPARSGYGASVSLIGHSF
jgi:hypothetical protein